MSLVLEVLRDVLCCFLRLRVDQGQFQNPLTKNKIDWCIYAFFFYTEQSLSESIAPSAYLNLTLA